MVLTLSILLGLAQRCAPSVAPATLLTVAKAESGFDALALAANGTPRRVYHPATAEAAVRTAGRLISQGASVDLGLGQINSRNLAPLGLSLADAFDPCRNLEASARVLQAGYQRATRQRQGPQEALLTAFSFYNTGDAARGFRNGYVARVTRTAAQLASSLPTAEAAQPGEGPPPGRAAFAEPRAAALLVF